MVDSNIYFENVPMQEDLELEQVLFKFDNFDIMFITMTTIAFMGFMEYFIQGTTGIISSKMFSIIVLATLASNVIWILSLAIEITTKIIKQFIMNKDSKT